MTKRLILATLALAGLIYLLSQVFSGRLILPQSFRVGALDVHYYGLIMAAAVAGAFGLALARSRRYGIGLQQAEDLLFWLIVGGFIGARIYHVFSSAEYYWRHPLDSLKVWNGGLSIYGAVIGGVITLWLYKRISHFRSPAGGSILNYLDWLAPSVILGQIIGRFGNFFNYEAFGYPTNLPWKMFVPLRFRPFGFGQYRYFHPFFLYEALGNAVILFVLLKFLEPKFRRQGGSGRLFFSYLLLYNTLRFFLEFLRIDSTFLGASGLRLNVLSSLALVIAAALALRFIDKQHSPARL